MKTPAVQDVKQGKYFQIDFRLIKPLDLAGGNVRHQYEGIPELAYSFIETGSVAKSIDTPPHELVRASEILKDVPREQWSEKLKGKFLIGGINTALVGYSKSSEESEIGRYYHTLAGHRRTLAANYLFDQYGIVTVVPLVPKDVRGMSELDIIAFMLDENENRKGLSVLEQADIAKRMLDLGATIGQIAAKFGRARHYYFVKNLLKIQESPEPVKNMIASGKVAPSTVVDLIRKTENPDEVVAVLEKAYKGVEEKKSIIPGTKPVKVKRSDIDSQKPRINSQVELQLFFRRHSLDNDIKSRAKRNDEIFEFMQKIADNKISVHEIKQFFTIN